MQRRLTLRDPKRAGERTHSSHWGSFLATPDGAGVRIRANPFDPDPSALLHNIPDSIAHPSRVAQPMIRRGWLERGPGADRRRGSDEFVAVSWDAALRAVADELSRVRASYGCKAIFGGSYGWSSAGRFHHAQSQVHRFLNCLGGYVYSVNTYSAGASEVVLPHVMGSYSRSRSGVSLRQIAEQTELIVAFGGMPAKNSQVGAGGIGRHALRDALESAHARGARFVSVSPLRDDLPERLSPQWLALRPGTDVALMLAIAHTLLIEQCIDREFLERCTTGFPTFEKYLRGESDGCPKTPEWAEPITELTAADIAALARRMASKRTLITTALSLQRAAFGEQPVWMGMVLAAMLGSIGLPGAGYMHSLGALGNVAKDPPLFSMPSLPQGQNPVRDFIPVARIADMLLQPGERIAYNGSTVIYPHIKLAYWAGGNPFHHHQNLSRLSEAFGRLDTFIVHEPFWTATARHADIVLPSTITLERNDIGGISDDHFVVAMQKVVRPYAQSRSDYDIFSDLADQLSLRQSFTEGRSEEQWLRHMYAQLTERAAAAGYEAPDFDSFWAAGELELPTDPDASGWAARFRSDPRRFPIETPSGKLEIFSNTIASFGYRDCPGHPSWLEPEEWLGGPRARIYPLQLIANQPSRRLHSQLDFGSHSVAGKRSGREVMRIHPTDAARRNLADGDVARVFNCRGAMLVATQISNQVRQSVVQVSTGAWYEPVTIGSPPILACNRGNPNSVTRDAGTSQLAQGCTGQVTLVEVEKFSGHLPQGKSGPRDMPWTP